MLPALLAAGAGASSLIGGIIGNRSRSKEAAKNRSFQERMRNTSWQAGVADMEAAGLNPALAYQQGGASSPSGAMATQEDVISPAVSSAMAAKRLAEEIQQIKANVSQTKMMTQKTQAERDAIRGRPGRIAEPFVDIGVDVARALVDPDSPVRRGINRAGRAYVAPAVKAWEWGTSFTKRVRDAITKIREGRGAIGFNTTPRRR